jgi:hypothetical protein
MIATAAIVVLTNSAMAQQPYAGLQNRSIKTLSANKLRTSMQVAEWALRLPLS